MIERLTSAVDAFFDWFSGEHGYSHSHDELGSHHHVDAEVYPLGDTLTAGNHHHHGSSGIPLDSAYSEDGTTSSHDEIIMYELSSPERLAWLVAWMRLLEARPPQHLSEKTSPVPIV